jgi:hypothetical protein
VFFSLLQVLFIGLKMTGYLAWPWVWVFLPFYVGSAWFIFVLLIAVALSGK